MKALFVGIIVFWAVGCSVIPNSSDDKSSGLSCSDLEQLVADAKTEEGYSAGLTHTCASDSDCVNGTSFLSCTNDSCGEGCVEVRSTSNEAVAKKVFQNQKYLSALASLGDESKSNCKTMMPGCIHTVAYCDTTLKTCKSGLKP